MFKELIWTIFYLPLFIAIIIKEIFLKEALRLSGVNIKEPTEEQKDKRFKDKKWIIFCTTVWLIMFSAYYYNSLYKYISVIYACQETSSTCIKAGTYVNNNDGGTKYIDSIWLENGKVINFGDNCFIKDNKCYATDRATNTSWLISLTGEKIKVRK